MGFADRVSSVCVCVCVFEPSCARSRTLVGVCVYARLFLVCWRETVILCQPPFARVRGCRGGLHGLARQSRVAERSKCCLVRRVASQLGIRGPLLHEKQASGGTTTRTHPRTASTVQYDRMCLFVSLARNSGRRGCARKCSDSLPGTCGIASRAPFRGKQKCNHTSWLLRRTEGAKLATGEVGFDL